MIIENEYRSHYCGNLDTTNGGEVVKLSGWMHSIRDHGGLVFIDLRDQFGLAQIVIDQQSTIFKKIESLRLESVISIKGKVILRSKETINDKIQTGKIEVIVNALYIISKSKVLPSPCIIQSKSRVAAKALVPWSNVKVLVLPVTSTL